MSLPSRATSHQNHMCPGRTRCHTQLCAWSTIWVKGRVLLATQVCNQCTRPWHLWFPQCTYPKPTCLSNLVIRKTHDAHTVAYSNLSSCSKRTVTYNNAKHQLHRQPKLLNIFCALDFLLRRMTKLAPHISHIKACVLYEFASTQKGGLRTLLYTSDLSVTALRCAVPQRHIFAWFLDG